MVYVLRLHEGSLTVQDLKEWNFQGIRSRMSPVTRVVQICPSQKFVFILSQKVASRSIRKCLQSTLTDSFCNSNKRQSGTYETFVNTITNQQLSEYFVATFVRNPWDRFVSAYCHFTHKAKRWNDNNRFWVHSSFESLVKNKEKCEAHTRMWLHFRPQHHFTDVNGVRVANFVGKFENLQEDIDRLSDLAGLPKFSLPHINKSKRGSYRDYFNDQTKQIVAGWNQDVIDEFGYTF